MTMLPDRIYLHLPNRGPLCDYCGKDHWEGMWWPRLRWNRAGLLKLIPRVRWERLYEPRDVRLTSTAGGGIQQRIVHLCSATCHRRWNETRVREGDNGIGKKQAVAWGKILRSHVDEPAFELDIEAVRAQARARWNVRISVARQFTMAYSDGGMPKADYFRMMLGVAHVPPELWPEWEVPDDYDDPESAKHPGVG